MTYNWTYLESSIQILSHLIFYIWYLNTSGHTLTHVVI
jgi:hypothetical protein